MTGPTILTTVEARHCNVCGERAVAGTGVARPLWWCLRCLPAGLANTAADLVIARFNARSEDEQRELEEASA